MKKIKILFCLLILTSVTISVLAQSSEKIDTLKLKNEFQLQTERWREAYNSKNAQNLLPLYTKDSQYISSHVAGLVADGRDKLIANFQNGMNMAGHIDSLEILRIDVSGDLATLLCKYQATNAGVTVVGRNLLILKKTNGVWLIAIHMTVV